MKTIKIFTDIVDVAEVKEKHPLDASSIETKINEVIKEQKADICDVQFSTQVVGSLYIMSALVVLEKKVE